MLKSHIVYLLQERHAALYRFWTSGHEMPEASVEAHCDMVYTLYMLGEGSSINASAVELFLKFLRTKNLPGWKPEGDQAPILVHNCAYAFGALNIISDSPAALYDAVLSGREMDLSTLLDLETKKPVFPPKWAHHNWRVSHWVGGVPSILLSVARSGTSYSQEFAVLVEQVRNATNSLLDKHTGLIKAYKSEVLQQLFRKLYSLRHDPELGDVGGVAHILWVDHAMKRPYLALRPLLAQSQKLFQRHPLFMEDVPYCLDFDIVQIVRTGLDQTGEDRSRDATRAIKMMRDIEVFFSGNVGPTYSLHKIPGALATYHECAKIGEVSTLPELSVTAVDIIERAHWL